MKTQIPSDLWNIIKKGDYLQKNRWSYIYTINTSKQYNSLWLSSINNESYFSGLNEIFQKITWFKPILLFFDPKRSVMVDDDNSICRALTDIGCNAIYMDYSNLGKDPKALRNIVDKTLGKQQNGDI